MNDYIYALPVTQPFKNINIYNNNCYSTAFTTTIETTTTNTNTTGTITVNKNIVCDDVSNDQKDYCYNYVTEPQQFESIPLSLFNVQKQNDSIVNDEYYVSEGNLLNSNNNNNLIINNHNNASLNCYNILPTQSYPFYPVKHNELTKNVYNSTQTNYFNKNDLDVQTQTNYISDNVDHNTTNITATTTDNNNNNTNNSIQLPTNNTYEYHQQITPTNEQHFYTSNLLDKFITKNDWNQQTMITESSNIIKCKTQNSLCHSSYELCNNQLLKNYAENSTEFIRLNENNHLQHQRLPHLTSDLDCPISNLSDYSIISKNDEVNILQTKSTYPLRTEVNRRRKSSNHIALEKSMSLFHDQHSSLSKYHHTLKTNRPTHKFNYHSTNNYNANGNYTTCNNVTRHLKSLQNKHITTDNNCCHTYDSFIHNEHLLESFNNENSSKVKNQTIIPSSSSSNSILSRSPYKCRKCKGHGMSEPVRQHKRNCPYRDCTCDMCYLVEKGRRIVAQQIALFRDQKSHSIQKLSHQKDRSMKNIIIKESLNKINEDNGPHCRRCRNHGQNISWKGHKKTCPYRECYCNQCILISLRKSNEKDLRNGEKKTSTKNTPANYETNTCSFNEKCHIINSNFNSTTSEDYIHNAAYNPYSNNDPIVSFGETCKTHDSFYPPLVNRTCVNSLIHHLVTSSITTSLDPFCTTHISKCENKQTYCSSTTSSHLRSIENSSLEPSTYREPFNNITKPLNFSENTNFLNVDKHEFNSQKIPNKIDSVFQNNHNYFTSFDCPNSLISSTISTNKIHESDHNTNQLLEFNSTQTFCHSNMNTGSSLMRTKYNEIVHSNNPFKTNYFDDIEVHSTNNNSEQFSNNQSIEINKSMLETKYHESYVTDGSLNNNSQNVSRNFIDYVNSSNDHLKNLDQQFKTNYSYPSQVNKEYTNNNFYHLQGYQKSNPSSLISSSTLKNTITDYIYHSEEKNTTYPTDYLPHSVNLNEEKLIRPTTNHAAALAAAAAAAVAFHHEVVSQQKHQDEYAQHIDDMKQVCKQSDIQLEQQNLFNTTTTTTTTTNDTISNINNINNINSIKEGLNIVQESINTPFTFLNMSNILNDNYDYDKQNYSNDHLLITSPLLKSFQTNYTQKIIKSNEQSLNSLSNMNIRNNLINKQCNSNLDILTNYPLNSNKQSPPPPQQQSPSQQQQYLTKDTFNIHKYDTLTNNMNIKQLSTIKYDKITDLIQHNSNVKFNQEINKLQIIHLTNAIILPSKQLPYEYDDKQMKWSTIYPNIQSNTIQQQERSSNNDHNSNNCDTRNSLPNECNNILKNFEVSTNVFKQIGL
ncbi:unnamed protein product [Schistosoma margrebowiei]|uniref:DM domain-containing protein n=1 Tax=Schistosoma margrebowiei TaxID=48269 RepID=A0AA85A9R2_9TREM|nr:unnamed protein product [Schistosoma margrebowiei]